MDMINQAVMANWELIFHDILNKVSQNRLKLSRTAFWLVALPALVGYSAYVAFGLWKRSESYEFRRYWGGITGVFVGILTAFITWAIFLNKSSSTRAFG